MAEETPPSSGGNWKDRLRSSAAGLFGRARKGWDTSEISKKIQAKLPQSYQPAALAAWATQTAQGFKAKDLALTGKVLTIVLSTWFLADLTSLVVDRYIPEPPVARTLRTDGMGRRIKGLDEYNVIFSRNLFNSQGLIPGEEGGPGKNMTPDLGGPPVKSSLPFNLIGTLILKDELRSIATIEDKAANIVYPVRVEDEIPQKARIIRVEPTRVIFLNVSTGRREYIDLPEDIAANNQKITVGTRNTGPGIEKVSPTQYNVARTEVDKALSDLNNVLTQARCVPNFENGAPAGYKCFQIVPGSIYDKLGMRDGDVICGINGQNIDNPATAFQQLGELRQMNHLELCIKRDGRVQQFAYDIR